MEAPAAAGLDLGTTRVKLVLYSRELEPLEELTAASPLEAGPGRASHDPGRLRLLLQSMSRRARERGAAVLGLATYRASAAAWRPGGSVLEGIVLWLDRDRREEARRGMPLWGRLASLLPGVGKAFRGSSPLPLIALLSRRHPGARVWTVEALASEWLGAGYTTEPGSASATGMLDPRSMEWLRLIPRLAGVPGWHERPALGDTARPEGWLGALAADQQAALMGLPCLDESCLKLSLGTGGFATRPLRRPPSLVPGPGLVPLAAYRMLGERLWAVEAIAPGLGLAVAWVAGLLGGFRELERLQWECWRRWAGTLLLPYPGGGGSWLLSQVPGGRRDLACAAIAGAVLAGLDLAYRHSREGLRRVYLVGGVLRLEAVRLLLARLLPAEAVYCPGDPTPRGVAAAALAARGLAGWPPPPMGGCTELGGGDRGLGRPLALLARRLAGLQGEGAWRLLSEARGLLLGAVEGLRR